MVTRNTAADGCQPSTQSGSDDALRLSRRHMLRSSVGGVTAGVLASTGVEIAAPRPSLAQSKLTPDAALKALLDGNRRFVEQRLTFYKEDLRILKQNTAEKQEPFASVLSCADSRVPVEIVFDQSIGRVFVNRVAGNLATSEIIASIEYGVAVLGTRVLMVLGHANCGAVKASIAAKEVPGQISALYRHIRPAVDEAHGEFEATIKANAKIQAKLLNDSSPVVRERDQGRQAQNCGRLLRSRHRQSRITRLGRVGETCCT